MLAQHLDLVMVGKDDHIVAFLYHRDLAKHPNVLIQSEDSQDQRTQFFLRFLKSRSHEAPGNAESGLTTSNNEVSSDEQATKCSGAALIKEPPWASHTTAATCDSTSVGCSSASTLAGPRRTIFPPRLRSRPHLCSFGSISPTVRPLDFSVHVIWRTGPYARSSERWHEQKLFGQLSQIAVVVQNLIFRTTTVTDCIRQRSVVSPWQPHSVRRARQSTHLEAHLPSETVDSSEVECGSQQFQFTNVPHQPPFELQCLERRTTLETREI